MKKGAIELSIGTIVIIVLAMSMLILGLVLIRNIFQGAVGTSELVDKNVKAQLNKLFNDEETKILVYLPDNIAEVKKGESYNVRFAIRNVVRADSGEGLFTYDVRAGEIQQGCRISPTQAEKYIIQGSSGKMNIAAGTKPVERVILVEIPEDAPLCSMTYEITVRKDGQIYDSSFFILRITA